MAPKLEKGAFIFAHQKNFPVLGQIKKSDMLFREEEGFTVILPASTAKNLENLWAKIILTIHSDLNAVGFLAAILPKLAQAGISVNVVSAYFHDHLFVPYKKRFKALKFLKSVNKNRHKK